MNRFCYNCGDKSHISRFCEKKQRISRCPECDAICLNGKKHKYGCGNTDFKSVFLANNYVVITPIIGIKFLSVPGVSMVDNFPIEEGTKLLFGPSLLERKNDVFWFNGDPDENYVISIIDGNDIRRAMFDIGNFLIVNKYYHISAAGKMLYDPFIKQHTIGRSVINLKVHSVDDAIQMHIEWSGRSFYFDAYQNGMVYIDPAKKKIQASTENASHLQH